MSDEGDWGELAPYWHLFEHSGSDASVGEAALADGARAPLLYVGAGIGTYAAALAKRVGHVIGVDRSPAMAEHASARIPTVVADVRTLPFGDATFQGVIVATGVVETLGESLVAAFRELRRVASGGPIHVAAFIDTGVILDRHAALAAWLAEKAPDPDLDRLAGAIGDRSQAAALMKRAMPRYAAGIRERAVIDAAAAALLSTRRLLDERGFMLWRHQA